jgi:hypothetical protein
MSTTVPWDLAESQRIAGKCWPKVGLRGCLSWKLQINAIQLSKIIPSSG